MAEAIARLSEYLVVIRGHDLDSQKTSTLACLLGDEMDPSILQCKEKNPWLLWKMFESRFPHASGKEEG